MSVIPVPPEKKKAIVTFVRPPESETLEKSIVNVLKGFGDEEVHRIGFEMDPARLGDYGTLYYPKINAIPDAILKKLAVRASIVAAIVQARSAHISSFGRPQTDRFSTGFRIEPRPGVVENLSELEREDLDRRIVQATKKLLTCGETTGWHDDDRLNLSQFLQQIARDGIITGRFATEVIFTSNISTGKKEFHSFRPLDAATIFRAKPQNPDDPHSQLDSTREQALSLLEQANNKRLVPEKFRNNEYSWVQVVDGRLLQAFTSEELLVHSLYPVTDISLGGYPLTPIDTVISDVMTFINITNHNKLYFQNGRAARGMIVIKSEDVSQQIVDGIQQQFEAAINSTRNAWRMPVFGIGPEDEIAWQAMEAGGGRDMEFQYLSDQNARVILSAFQMSPEELPGYAHLCLHPNTRVWTDKGFVSIGELLGEHKEVDGFRVWTGTHWEEARAFVAGKKRVARTKTTNRIEIVSSPDHLFRVVDEDGDLVWRKQEDLRVGDHVLVNKKPIPGSEDVVPSYNGKRLTPEMMEVLGWLTGDGTITVRKRGKKQHSKELELYYNNETERGIRDRHAAIMKEWGLNPLVRDRELSKKAIERHKEKYGFDSVTPTRPMVFLYDTPFVEWLLEIGFRSSREGKVIPPLLHSLPVEYRAAFLRGFFSADGSRDKLDTPSITIASDTLREETKLLLLGMGIRTRGCEGTSVAKFEKSGDKVRQTRVRGSNKLIVKDKIRFFDLIGFLQDHKQPSEKLYNRREHRWDKLPRSLAVWLYGEILKTPEGQRDRDAVRHSLVDPKYDNQVRDKLVNLANKYGVELPGWVDDFYFEQVAEVEHVDDQIEMVDLEVFDDVHAFIAQGVIVHNSRGSNNQALAESNNEWKLTAARDVGFRPLLSNIQDFFNDRIMPLIDPKLASLCYFRFAGLDADTPEKETTRLQQDGTLHMTYNEILEKVEKDPLPPQFGGDFPLNPVITQLIQNYVPFGVIQEQFFGVEGASKDPEKQFVQNPMWFQWYQIRLEERMMEQQMAQQEQMIAQEQAAAEQEAAEGEEAPPEEGEELEKAEKTKTKTTKEKRPPRPASRKKLLDQHEKTVRNIMDKWEEDSKAALAKIMKEVAAEVKRAKK